MKIRKAINKDIPSLIRIVKGVPSIEDYPGEYDKKLFEKMLKDKETILLVAEIENKVVGFKEFKIDKSAKRVYGESIAVAKDYRKQGIGSALFNAMEYYAKKHKFKRISFIVRDWNESMNSLAKKNKYKLSDKFNFWEKEI
jgi:ribosomal protein S18 acetylase RimI-like enzyme